MSPADPNGQLSRWLLRALVIVMVAWVALWAATDGLDLVITGT